MEKGRMDWMDALEIPFMSATTLDASLGSGGKAGPQKVRVSFTPRLGPTKDLSLGRKGTVHLAGSALLTCQATAYRWNRATGDRLCKAYLDAGLRDLVASKRYLQMLDMAADAIKVAASIPSPAHNVPALVATVLCKLLLQNTQLQQLALEMREITERVDKRFQEVRVFRGRLERIQGPEALLVIDTGERRELRRADANYLAASGIQNRGDGLVLHELQWTPDTVSQVILPAVDLRAAESDAKMAKLDAELRAAETPLP